MNNVMHKFLIYFIYLLLPYMFRAFFKPIFSGRCTISAAVIVSWVWYQRPGADTILIMLVIIKFHSKLHGPYNIKPRDELTKVALFS
jgi:hypothetical protein